MKDIPNGTVEGFIGRVNAIEPPDRLLPNRLLWRFFLCRKSTNRVGPFEHEVYIVTTALVIRGCIGMAYPSGASPPTLELVDNSRIPSDFVHVDMHVGNGNYSPLGKKAPV